MTHKCAADGCKKEISLSLLMCRKHWKLVPRKIQRAIWRTRLDRDRNRYYAHIVDAINAVSQAETGGQLVAL
ncbi:MAG: hypothetical protein ACJ8AK_03165 [Gemmatimonadaceae bacterium]